MKFVFHEDELGALFFGELEYRDTGGLSQDFGDKAFVYDALSSHVSGAVLLLKLYALNAELLLFVALGGGEFEVLVFDGLLFGNLGRNDSLFDFAKLWR